MKEIIYSDADVERVSRASGISPDELKKEKIGFQFKNLLPSEIKMMVENVITENPPLTTMWYLFDSLPRICSRSKPWAEIGRLIINEIIKNDPAEINQVVEKIAGESYFHAECIDIKFNWAFYQTRKILK